MKVNSLSISIPSDAKCNKNCPYCISKMTGSSKGNFDNFFRNLNKVEKVASHADVSSVIITGKTEPLLEENMKSMLKIGYIFRDYPLEIQTNGIMLHDQRIITCLRDAYINTIAISIDSFNQFNSLSYDMSQLSDMGYNIRATVNLTTDIMSHELSELFEICKKSKVDQLSLRVLTVPNYRLQTKESDKAAEYIDNIDVTDISKYLLKFSSTLQLYGIFIRKLSFGASVYMCNDISCTVFEDCIQENSDNDNIRSLVYYEDGHLSTSWYGSNFGRLF